LASIVGFCIDWMPVPLVDNGHGCSSILRFLIQSETDNSGIGVALVSHGLSYDLYSYEIDVVHV
jgi:hypothetical protein